MPEKPSTELKPREGRQRGLVARKYTDAQIDDCRHNPAYNKLTVDQISVLTGINRWTVASVRKGRRHAAHKKQDWKEEYRRRRGEDLRIFFIDKAVKLLETYVRIQAKFDETGEYDEPRERDLTAGDYYAAQRKHGRLGTAARRRSLQSRGGPTVAADDGRSDVAVADRGGAPGGGDGPRPADKPPVTVAGPPVRQGDQRAGARDDAVPGVFYDRR